MDIHIETPLPIEFGKEYYMMYKEYKNRYLQCTCCDGKGHVVIKDTRYRCPKCLGTKKTQEPNNSTYTEYYVSKLCLLEIGLKLINEKPKQYVKFSHTIPKSMTNTDTIELYIRENKLVKWTELNGLKKPDSICETKIYNNYKEVMEECEILNAEEQGKV